jgi:hypothetical protein
MDRFTKSDITRLKTLLRQYRDHIIHQRLVYESKYESGKPLPKSIEDIDYHIKEILKWL